MANQKKFVETRADSIEMGSMISSLSISKLASVAIEIAFDNDKYEKNCFFLF